MAIDPRISLALQLPETQTATQVSNIFQNNLNQAQNRRVSEQQFDQQQIINPLNAQILQQRATAGQGELETGVEERTLRLISESGNLLKPVIESGNNEQALSMLNNLRTDLESKQLPTQGTDRIIQQLQSGDSQGVLNAIDAVQQNARGRGLLGAPQVSVGQRDFNANVASVKADPNLETVKGKAAAVALGIEARASTSAQERIAEDPTLTSAVASSEAKIESAKSGAREGEKLKQQRKHLPELRKEIKLAEKAAIERGDVLSSLERSKAALPGLLNAVDQLKELAPIATSTFGGKIFDSAIKQTGFGSTKGATARAKFIAIINNQVLPLLKETFGAAFTAQEGESLKATMGDPDASPAEKMVQLDAFISQKQRDIQTRETQLGTTETQAPTVIRFDAQGNQI